MKSVITAAFLLLLTSSLFSQVVDTTNVHANDTLRKRSKISIGVQRSTSNGSLGTFIVTTSYGTAEIGSQNSYYNHIMTSLPRHYFNKPIIVNGTIGSYEGQDLILTTALTNRMYIKQNGNVGIGKDPGSEAQLVVYGAANPSFKLTAAQTNLTIGISTCNGCIVAGTKAGDAVIRQMGSIDGHHGIIFNLPNNTGDGNSYFKFGDDKSGLWFSLMNNKTVRVDGSIFAKEINVKTNVWADFVFDDNYKLRSIDEVEEFISVNKHLPDVPSETEIKANGVDVAKMNAILLQKVEELSLYLIEQNKRLNVLEDENKSLKAKLGL